MKLPKKLYLKHNSKGHKIFKRVWIVATDESLPINEFTVAYVRQGSELRSLRKWLKRRSGKIMHVDDLIDEIDRRINGDK